MSAAALAVLRPARAAGQDLASGIFASPLALASGLSHLEPANDTEELRAPHDEVASESCHRLVKDHLGSVRRVVDVSSGAVLQALEYDAWGRVLSDTNPGAQPFGFAGGLYDADTGLVRFGAREYSAEVGRWWSKDPIRFRGDGPNLYAYVENDPVNEVDPEGLHRFDKWFGYGGKAYRKFRRWVHDLKKNRELDGDVRSKEEMDDLFDEWDQAGRPDPDAKWYNDILECLLPPLIGNMCEVDLRFCQPGEADLTQ